MGQKERYFSRFSQKVFSLVNTHTYNLTYTYRQIQTILLPQPHQMRYIRIALPEAPQSLLVPEVLSKYTSAKVYAVQQHDHTILLDTNFGSMHLTILKDQSEAILNFRKVLYKQHPHFFPIICEWIEIDTPGSLSLLLLRQATRSLTTLDIEKAILQLTALLELLFNNRQGIRSSRLEISDICVSERSHKYLLQLLHFEPEAPLLQVTQFLDILSKSTRSVNNNKLYLLDDQAFRWKISQDHLASLKEYPGLDWNLFSIFMNLPHVRKRQIEYRLTDAKNKKFCMIQELSGTVELSQYGERVYQFKTGKSVFQYELVTPKMLSSQFFSPYKVYRVTKQNVVVIIKEDPPLDSNGQPMQKQISVICIEKAVERLECVEFLIVYMKYFKLNLQKLEYIKNTNQLFLHFENGRFSTIKFSKGYVVKEDELAILLNGCNLVDCSIILSQCYISDKMLILLSNLTKTENAVRIDLSGCTMLTEFGFSTLFESPYIGNLKELNLSRTAITDSNLQQIRDNTNITRLLFDNCPDVEGGVSFLTTTRFQYIQALNTNVLLQFGSKLQVLKLTIDFPLECLKNLSRMPLKQLKLRLVQHNRKQQLINFVNSIYSSSSHYAKDFCEGTPAKTLNSIDFSDSQVKFKHIRGIFSIQSLKTVVLNNCLRLGDDFDHLAKFVENVHINSSVVPLKSLRHFIERCAFIKRLDVCGCSLGKQEIQSLAEHCNQQIAELVIDKQQYSYQLLSLVNRPKVHTVNRLSIHIGSHPTEQIYTLVYQAANSDKSINFECDPSDEGFMTTLVCSLIRGKENTNVRIRGKQPDRRRIYSVKQDSVVEMKFTHCRDITNFTYHTLYKGESLLHLNISNNRYLSKDCVRLLTEYNISSNLKSFDFRNCLFTLKDVQDDILNWNNLEILNNGQIQVSWTRDTFSQVCQRYLRFFMRLKNIRAIDITCTQVKQVVILFSILFYLVNQQRVTLASFRLILMRMEIDIGDESNQFWQALLTTITLKYLGLRIIDCTGTAAPEHAQAISTHINRLSLLEVELVLPHNMTLLPIRLSSLVTLSLTLNDNPNVDANYLFQLLRSGESIEYLSIETQNCVNLTSLDRLCSTLRNHRRLKTLNLSLQHCFIKYNSLILLLETLRDLKDLIRIRIDVSFCFETGEDISVPLLTLADSLNEPKIELIALNSLRVTALEYLQELSRRNINVIR